jgi:hypothetical protein
MRRDPIEYSWNLIRISTTRDLLKLNKGIIILFSSVGTRDAIGPKLGFTHNVNWYVLEFLLVKNIFFTSFHSLCRVNVTSKSGSLFLIVVGHGSSRYAISMS